MQTQTNPNLVGYSDFSGHVHFPAAETAAHYFADFLNKQVSPNDPIGGTNALLSTKSADLRRALETGDESRLKVLLDEMIHFTQTIDLGLLVGTELKHGSVSSFWEVFCEASRYINRCTSYD
ncbi:MAG TPA: hypothetical protein VJI46_02015 [Candidatus Nanoarchaeia archaeon]|nr:hypothetical protein [Candidatus Nanoarchaeia archaeon]